MTQRIALVTGGSRGLGKNAALKLAAKGTDILLTYHSNRQAALDVVAEIEQKGVKAAALALNVGDISSFDAFASEVAQVLAQKWGRTTFDYLLNNAGIGLNVPFAETSEAQFDELMNIQFKGPFFLTQRLLPLLQDGGRILNVSSGLARFALPGYAAYAFIHASSSLSRAAMASPISSGSPTRPSAVWAAICRFTSALSRTTPPPKSVSMAPGAMIFTEIPRPPSSFA